METREFRYEVAVVVVFTDAELDLIRRCCANHYDGKVKSAASCGGFVYGWLNMRHFDKYGTLVGGTICKNTDPETETEFTCRYSQLDTIGKALEQPVAANPSKADMDLQAYLWHTICQLLKSMNTEHDRVNPAPEAKKEAIPS